MPAWGILSMNLDVRPAMCVVTKRYDEVFKYIGHYTGLAFWFAQYYATLPRAKRNHFTHSCMPPGLYSTFYIVHCTLNDAQIGI